MKKLLFVLGVILIVGCNCLSQIPPQYAYSNESCTAVMPNVLLKIRAQDNCDADIDLIQVPSAGAPVNGNIQGLVKATDKSGNSTTVTFDVILIDTISPKIFYNDSLIISFEQANSMYKTFVAWIKQDIDRLNGFPEFRELQVGADSARVWYNSIAIYEHDQ